MAIPTLPAAGLFLARQTTGVVTALNQLVAAARYLLADSGNPYPLTRSGIAPVNTDGNGNGTFTFPAFPTAVGLVLGGTGTGYVCRAQVTSFTNGTGTANFTSTSGGAIANATNLPLAFIATGN